MKPDSLGRLRGAPMREKIFAFSTQIPECGCWIWDRGCWPSGYGVIKRGGRSVSAHKTSFEAFVGEVPEGLDVLHQCDIKPCVNPEHLFLGTHQDNMLDARDKGILKPLRGEASGMAKLTEEDVRAIRSSGSSRQVDLAEKFGVSQGLISAILRGAIWKHILEEKAVTP